MTVRIDLSALSADDLCQLAGALRVAPGQRSLATRAALRQSDDAIRELAAFYPGTRNAQARAIHADLQRYAGSTWARTRGDVECRHGDRRRVLIWRILQFRGGRAPCVRLINGILSR
ncbi:hypothetical protein AS156_14265 [Bradyrhizobium macuxiense]|uniref:Uncharacterized protein n=1 Tax=Bradyrhizobium macuxiense TaxID=1755647 RepID=A0A109JK74_9BRAD|nr:hypothetical protein [Bradyrhizobium macuxiense]KWV50486.1 hypothetical protein AS156_14265 [Bradyrhizobium macuxiense]